MPFAMKKILVIQTAFIGDAILATSVLEKLHFFYPDCKLDILVRKGNESLFVGHPYLNQCLVWTKKENKYLSLFALIGRIRKQRYDVVVNLQRYASSGILTALSGAVKKIGFDKNPFSFLFDQKIKHEIGNGKHEVERNQLLIEKLTDVKFAYPRLYPTENNFKQVADYKSKPYVCFAPGSVWFTKQLPILKWIELSEAIPEDLVIFFLGAPTDADTCAKIINESKRANSINLCGKLSFLDSCALIKDAKMNFVNDSAPLHLASAMNAPTTAFFCSTLPEFGFTPLAEKKTILQVNYPLNCRPCGLHGHNQCPKKHFKCGQEILIPTRFNFE